MMEKSAIIMAIGIILLVLLGWGFIGSSHVSKAGNTCDFGVDNEGSLFCWKWHRNVVGDIQDNIDGFFDGEK